MHGELPARVPLSVRFTPPKPGKFRATYLFRVAKGFPAKVTLTLTLTPTLTLTLTPTLTLPLTLTFLAKVTLSGEATLLEENMDVIVTEQHLRLMQPGTLGY